MKKELKEQIKQDEITSGLEQAAAWAVAHRDELRIGGLVALVLAAAVFAITHVREQRAAEGDRALREALTSFEAPVASELPPGSERSLGMSSAKSARWARATLNGTVPGGKLRP